MQGDIPCNEFLFPRALEGSRISKAICNSFKIGNASLQVSGHGHVAEHQELQ